MKTTNLIFISTLDGFGQMLETSSDIEDTGTVCHNLAIDASVVRHTAVALVGQERAGGSRGFSLRC